MPICSWKLIVTFLEALFLFQNCYSKLKIQAIFMIFYCNIKPLPWRTQPKSLALKQSSIKNDSAFTMPSAIQIFLPAS